MNEGIWTSRKKLHCLATLMGIAQSAEREHEVLPESGIFFVLSKSTNDA